MSDYKVEPGWYNGIFITSDEAHLLSDDDTYEHTQRQILANQIRHVNLFSSHRGSADYDAWYKQQQFLLKLRGWFQ